MCATILLGMDSMGGGYECLCMGDTAKGFKGAFTKPSFTFKTCGDRRGEGAPTQGNTFEAMCFLKKNESCMHKKKGAE